MRLDMLDWLRRGAPALAALGAMVLAAGGAPGGARRLAPAASWTAVVAASGSVRLEYRGREVGTLEPGLFEAGWKGATLAPAKPGQAAARDRLAGQIHAAGGAIVDTELRLTKQAGGLHFAYRLMPRQEVSLNSLHVSLGLGAGELAGTGFVVDGATGAFPDAFRQVALRSGPATALDLLGAAPAPGTGPGAGRAQAGARALRFRIDAPTPVLLQDDRQWGPTFTVRIGPQMNEVRWPAGKPLDIAFTLSAQGGIAVEYDGPVTISAGADWLPLEDQLDIEPGSALDFSRLVAWHAPAGKYGRVIGTAGGRMALADRPKEPVRFYGFNLCFTAQCLPHAEADRLADRFLRLGYNAVRIHHYESTLVDRADGTSTGLNPQMLDRLDYLFAALKKRGIYVTTDLFVSRPVFNREIWSGVPGDIAMDMYKMAVPVNARAFANYKAFATALLAHVNPYTGMRWADDPTLAWLSLINEGAPGNFIAQVSGPLRDDWARAWNAWLIARYPDRAARARAIGAPAAVAASTRDTVPLPAGAGAADWPLFNAFLADNQRDFFARTKAFLRDDLHCGALLTNMNAWTNPISIEAVRPAFDYVDDHFYVDHPQFLESPWQLPSRSNNTSPVAQGAPGGRSCAFIRLLDRPFTCSEFNYSGPGRYRGVGGILTGALGAVQDWSVIWRFAYSHSRDNLFTPQPAGYFDMATDPLSQAADRASLCLFRRGDLRPAPHSVAVTFTQADAATAADSARGVVPGWNGLAWVTKVGSLVSEDPAHAAGADLLLPIGGATPRDAWRGGGVLPVDPYAAGAGDAVLAELRKRGWVGQGNPTDLKANRFQSETGELTIDAPADTLTVDTPCTAGGYAPAGTEIRTRAATIVVREAGATVWVSSLDSKPIRESHRLLVSHLTDLQNAGARYADRAQRVLLAWGGLPHLVRRGSATVTLHVGSGARVRAWGLSLAGKRAAAVPVEMHDGAAVLALDVDAGGRARMLYEVEIER
ncbi:MAG TPA: hypothetical protein VKT77_19910 [Chthonomonadaceae bacterium]|nr:hypothetical protein [Chthonomonadaceae bacterium]